MQPNFEKKFGSPAEELEWLKKRYEDKKAELEKTGESAEEAKAAETVLKEHIGRKPEEVLQPYYRVEQRKEEDLVAKILKLPPESHDKKIEELLGVAEESGIINAVAVARKVGNPHLEDDLHRALVQYYLMADLPKKKIKKPLSGSLQMILYEISLPRGKSEEESKNKEKSFKELVSAMEQFYAGMGAVQEQWQSPYFALELGIPAVGEEIAFYAAVPRTKAGLLEKHVMALFPDAKIREKRDDYNIFKPEGASAGAVMALKTHEVLPIRTYDKFDVDPLAVIINVFSKLKKIGEGAALQLIVGGSDDGFGKKIKKTADEMRKGEKLYNAMKKAGAVGGVFNFISEIFSGSPDKKKDKNKTEEERVVDENTVKLLDEKAAKPIMTANIRLLVSADNAERAKMILKEIESAFLQFTETSGNSLKFKELKGSALEKLSYDFSFRNFSKQETIRLNLGELSTIFHFPAGISSSAQLKYAEAKDAPPPLNSPEAGLALGVNFYRGDEKYIYMKDDDRRRHFYVIGQTGTGKSVLLKNMIVQDIEAGRGVCYIDPHGSDLEDILARIPEDRADDLIYFDPADTERAVGLNMLEYDPNYPEQKTFIANEIYSIFRKIWKDVPEAFGPMFEQYYRNAVLLVMDDPGSGNTLFEVVRVLSDKKFRDLKLAKCQNPMVRLFWKDVAEKAGGEASLANIVPYITSKFDVFLGNHIMRPIIAQEKSTINFRKIMDEKKILLVNLSKGRLGDINSSLLGLIFVGKILMSALSRVNEPEEKRNDFYLYIDEFQNVTTDSIASILSEARKYKLNLIVAHQFIAQLEETIKKAVFGNVGSMAAFRVGSEDAEFLAKQFEPVFGANDLLNIGNYNCYLKMLVDGQAVRPFNIKTVPFKKGDPEAARTLAKISSLKHGRLIAEVEKEISNKYNLG